MVIRNSGLDVHVSFWCCWPPRGVLMSSRINIEPIYLYCSDFAGGAQCTLEFPVVFECSPGSHSKADRSFRTRHIRGVYRKALTDVANHAIHSELVDVTLAQLG